jgi:hypothetical protein
VQEGRVKKFRWVILCAFFGVVGSVQAQVKIPCQKVFVTGEQKHEIAWALKGEGLKNKLYQRTCLEPVQDKSQATAILWLLYNPKLYPGKYAESMAGTCKSTWDALTCYGSNGKTWQVTCDGLGNCSSFYGQSSGNLLIDWVESSAALVFLYDVKTGRLLWSTGKSDGSTWNFDLAMAMECKKGNAFSGRKNECTKRKALLP